MANLLAAVHTYQVQSVLIALIFALYAHALHNPALYLLERHRAGQQGILIFPGCCAQYVLKIHGEGDAAAAERSCSPQALGILAALLVLRWVFTHHDGW